MGGWLVFELPPGRPVHRYQGAGVAITEIGAGVVGPTRFEPHLNAGFGFGSSDQPARVPTLVAVSFAVGSEPPGASASPAADPDRHRTQDDWAPEIDNFGFETGLAGETAAVELKLGVG